MFFTDTCISHTDRLLSLLSGLSAHVSNSSIKKDENCRLNKYYNILQNFARFFPNMFETLFFWFVLRCPARKHNQKGPEHNSKVQLCCHGVWLCFGARRGSATQNMKGFCYLQLSFSNLYPGVFFLRWKRCIKISSSSLLNLVEVEYKTNKWNGLNHLPN